VELFNAIYFFARCLKNHHQYVRNISMFLLSSAFRLWPWRAHFFSPTAWCIGRRKRGEEGDDNIYAYNGKIWL
jgi:hypothetical protein